ncbi:MAG TPA: hypothetical protein VHI13_15435 [Candidatus Kapabacteria bacterium]|nr:hypothetical protein [Candidatus Kapabacteria bacterium]
MLPTQHLELRKSRRLGEVLNLTFQYLRENSRTLIKSLLYIAGPAILLTGALSGTHLFGISSVLGLRTIVSPFVGTILGIVFGLITSMLVQGITNQHVRLYLERNGGEITVDDIWKAIKADLGRMFAINLSVGLVVGLAFFLYAIALSASDPGIRFLAFVVIMCPLIYISVPLAFTIPASIQERLNVSQSFARGFALVRKNWWNCLGVVMALGGVGFVISMVFLVPMLMLIALSDMFNGSANSERLSVIYAICAILAMTLSYLVSLLPTLGVVLQYHNLVEKVDAVGILARIGTIGESEDEPEHHSFLS